MRRITQFLPLCALFVVLVACQSVPTLPSGVLIVRNGTVIDGTGAEPIPNALVAIKDGIIVAVGSEDEFKLPEDAQVIDANGGTIMPGLIDAHVHAVLAGTNAMSRFLKYGFTTVRDLTSPHGKSADVGELQAELDELGNTIPRVVFTGARLTAVDGFKPAGGIGSIEVADVEEAREAAERLLAAGVHGIKIDVESGASRSTPILTPEQITAITQVAHEQGTWVSAHITHPSDAEIAVANGVDDLAHSPAGQMSDELIGQMVTQDVIMVTTLAFQEGWFGDENIREIRPDNFRRFLDAGGKVAFGTDIVQLALLPSRKVEEMQRMLDVGMKPMQVIIAATQHAAQVCGLGEQVGTLEVGKQADVIVINGDPLQDIQALDEVTIVIKGGEVIVQPEDTE